MRYQEIAITERTKRIKEAYLKLPVAQETNPYVDKKYRRFCTGDRWMTLGYLRGWQKHGDAATTRLRTSYAEAEELYQAQPVILEDELLVGHLYLPEYSGEEQEEYDRLCDMFQMSAHTLKERSPRKDHLCLDFEKLLRVGVNGLRKEIEEKKAALDLNDAMVYPDYEVIKKYEFYQCLLIELDAVLDLAARYAKRAKELAQKATEPRKTELLRIADVMDRVPAEPANSFYEAIQSVQFFLSTLFGLYPLGRPDRYLYEYYQKDMAKGSLTQELAQELIDNFCLYITDRVFSRAACGFIVGGQDSDGNLVENDLTYMFLTALKHLKLPDPNGALAVNAKTSDELLAYSAQILAEGTTHPAFYNDDVIVNSLIQNYGVCREDAVNYIHSTCAEISIAGKTRSHTTPMVVDMPRILHDVVRSNPDCKDLEELLQHYTEAMKKSIQRNGQAYLLRMLEASRIGNEPMRVCGLIDNCIERGKSIYEGGEKYTFIQPIFVGFATAVDSVKAFSELVFTQKRLGGKDFLEITEQNFEGNEALRQYIVNKLPHYGNDDRELDALAKQMADCILEIFRQTDIPGGALMMPGTFSYTNHAGLGRWMNATFDGRWKGYSYSDGCCPVQGRDVNGPTAMINSLTSWEQSRLLGGMVVNIKFGTDHLRRDNTRNFLAILKNFIARGGIELQVNVVDRDTLEDARVSPEKHGDLLVRIGGYSEYFTRLNPTLQQEVIDRTQY